MRSNPQMQNEALIMQILMLSNQNAILHEETIAAQKKAKEVMAQNDTLIREMTVVKEQLNQANLKYREATRQNAALKESAETQKKTKEIMERNDALVREVSALKNEMSAVKNKLNQANLKYREVTKRNAVLEEQRKVTQSTMLRRMAYKVAEKGVLGLFKK